MGIMVSLIRLVLFLASILGYYHLLNNKYKIKEEFIPIIIFTSIISVLFIAGILNMLLLATIGIFIGGLVLFIKSLLNHEFKFNFPIGITIMFAFFIYFFIVYYNSYLLQFDNFSHWALIVREMLVFDKLPNFESKVVTFTAYQPGSALFIYYFNRIVGAKESFMVIGQTLLILATMAPIYSFVKQKSKLIYTAITSLILAFLVVNSTLDNLLVDTLLPLVGLVGILIIMTYKKDFKKTFYLMVPISIALVLIKNSGIFFFLVNLIFFIYTHKNTKLSKKEQKIYFSLAAIIPLIFLFIWSRHIAYVFPSGLAKRAKHALSIHNFGRSILTKSLSDINLITNLFIKRVLLFGSKYNVFLLGYGAIVVGIHFISKKFYDYKKSNLLKTVGICFVVYIIYLINLYFMYLFSMPMGESSYLASYERYVYSVIIFIVGILFVSLVQHFNTDKIDTSLKKIIIILLITFNIYIMVLSNQYHTLLGKQYYNGSLVQIVDTILSGKKFKPYLKYVVYYKEPRRNGFYGFLLKYKLTTDSVTLIKDFELFNAKDYDYLIILTDDEIVDNYMNSIDNHIGIYSLKR